MHFKTKDIQIEIKANLEKNEIEAYASTWDKDLGGDTITKGAFSKTLKERFNSGQRRDIKVLWQHDMHQPIGLPTHMEEDSTGLYTVSKIADTALGREAMQLAREGIIDKMSIGYDAIKSKDDGTGGRILTELKLFEYSLVTFPMNEKADILQAKDLQMSQGLWNMLQKFGYTDIAQLIKGEKGAKQMDEEKRQALIAAIQESINALGGVKDLLEEEGDDDEGSDGGSDENTDELEEEEKAMNKLITDLKNL